MPADERHWAVPLSQSFVGEAQNVHHRGAMRRNRTLSLAPVADSNAECCLLNCI